jgi:hypothetical protein
VIVLCVWCLEAEDRPALLREVEPHSHTGPSHWVCAMHSEEWRERLWTQAQAGRAQAQGETES